MSLKLSCKFLSSIPTGDKKYVIPKCENFYNELIENEYNFRKLPSGFWIREIKSKKSKNYKIYKFRLNSKDRILFTYVSDSNKLSSVIFLQYVKHDKQVRIASDRDWEIQRKAYLDEEDDDMTIENLPENLDTMKKVEYPFYHERNLINMEKYKDVLAKSEEDRYLYVLNSSQQNILEKSLNKACFLTGSAGSGKTTVTFYKILNLLRMNVYHRIAYITYTEKLRDKIKKMYNDIIELNDESETTIDFITFDDLHKLVYGERRNESIIGFSEFENWLESLSMQNVYFQARLNRLKKSYTSMDIFTEIRGQIKGGMGIDYSRKVQIEDRFLSLDEYFSLPKDYSIYNNDEKEVIYKLARDFYENWLKDNSYYDDNDLCLDILMEINEDNCNPYDYIIIDEAQDFTELQLHTLLTLVKFKSNIFLSGDTHQIVHSSFFREGRIRSLLYSRLIDFENMNLNLNYRNQGRIVELANKIHKKRIEILGRMDEHNFEDGKIEEALIKEGNKPIICKLPNKDFHDFVYKAIDASYITIITGKKEDSEFLKKKYNTERVFTIQEYKGLEDRYIIGYNLLTSSKDTWENILSGKIEKSNKYRYYFNLLYVAVTRARENLCLYEDEIPKAFYDCFDSCFEKVHHFDSWKLHLDEESSDEEFEQKAIRYESDGKFRAAAEIYERLNNNDKYHYCLARDYDSKGKYYEAGLELLKAMNEDESFNENKYKLVIDYFIKIEDAGERFKALLELSNYYNNTSELVDAGVLNKFLIKYQDNEKVFLQMIEEYLIPKIKYNIDLLEISNDNLSEALEVDINAR